MIKIYWIIYNNKIIYYKNKFKDNIKIQVKIIIKKHKELIIFNKHYLNCNNMSNKKLDNVIIITQNFKIKITN